MKSGETAKKRHGSIQFGEKFTTGHAFTLTGVKESAAERRPSVPRKCTPEPSRETFRIFKFDKNHSNNLLASDSPCYSADKDSAKVCKTSRDLVSSEVMTQQNHNSQTEKRKYSLINVINVRKNARTDPPNFIIQKDVIIAGQDDHVAAVDDVQLAKSRPITKTTRKSICEATTSHAIPFSLRKPSSVATSIRSTLRRSSLVSLALMRRGTENLPKCSNSTINSNNKLFQAPSSESMVTSVSNISEAHIPSSPSLSLGRQSVQRYLYENKPVAPSQSNSASSSIKKTMRKRFSSAKIALRKLSLSSVSVGHVPVCSSLASPRTPGGSLQNSAATSPIRQFIFSYFSDQNASSGMNTCDETGDLKYKSSVSRAGVSRVFRKKSATSPTSKRSLGPSLSWDPEQRSRSPSMNSRSRIHSDGSDHSHNHQDAPDDCKQRKKSSCFNDSGIYDRLELVHSCLHCSLSAEHRRNQLRAEIETAVQRLSKRLNGSAAGRAQSLSTRPNDRNSPLVNCGNLSPADSLTSGGGDAEMSFRHQQRMGTPDIVVSSFSSDDENIANSGYSSVERLSLKGVDASFAVPSKPLAVTKKELSKQRAKLADVESPLAFPLQPPPEVMISQDIGIFTNNNNLEEFYHGESDKNISSSSTSQKGWSTERKSDRPPPLNYSNHGQSQSIEIDSPLLTPNNAPLTSNSIGVTSPLSLASSTLSPLLGPDALNMNSGFISSEGEMSASSSAQPIGDFVNSNIKSPTPSNNSVSVDFELPTEFTKDFSSNIFDSFNTSTTTVSTTTIGSGQKQVCAMDTLKPPGYYLPISVQTSDDLTEKFDEFDSRTLLTTVYGCQTSPPRSNSIDLSTLRRDIELWSISSGETGCSGAGVEKNVDGTFCNLQGNTSPGEGSAVNGGGNPPPASPADTGTVILGARTNRSRSHDPAECPEHILRRPSRIEHLSEIFRKALAKSPVVKRAAAIQENEQRRVSKHRTSRYWLDEQLKPSEHIWLPSSSSGSASNSNDTECYIGESDCERIGEKRRCAACHIVAHTSCFHILSKMNLVCKTTFRDCSASGSNRQHPSKETWDALTKHHWVHRWKLEGRCQHCSKSFQQKMFRDKEVIAITCSWCKKSYHNKRSCFSTAKFDEKCDRGALRDLILPPSWLLRLPNSRKRLAKNALANTTKKLRRKYRPFIVKPMEQLGSGPCMPLLVFVNPKSGGNKGHKALHTLCWLLNPRQVFDITALKGPKYGLEMFRKVATQLKILVAGGDGTVGWVLSTLDQLNWPSYPPMALVPLGTGNDLSRCMGWGGVFSDEPLSEILSAILHETSVTYLDRWRLDVQPNTSLSLPDSTEDHHHFSETLQSALPLTVMNNYFSIGADAHVALQFHHSRSANPQMLNSRLKNRIAYGGLGTIDLFKRTWKDLSEYMSLECDDVDITWKIREMKVHCVLFHNINFYAGGTIPWGDGSSDGEHSRPSCCDGKIEVLGFTTATLAALQMGGKGQIIAQCSKIRILTTKPIPMQVDGEPCLLAPSLIKLSFHSKVPMLKREKNAACTPTLNFRRYSKSMMAADEGRDLGAENTSVFMHVPVIVVGRHDFDTYRDSIDRLRDTGFEVGVVSLEAEMELLQMRILIQKLLAEHPMLPYEPKKEWRFVDYVSNVEEGVFRVSRHSERSHAISDICNLDDCILILDDSFPSITNRSAAIGQDLIFAPAAK